MLIVEHTADNQLKQQSSVPVPGYILESRMVGSVLYVVSQQTWQERVVDPDTGAEHIKWESGLNVSKMDLADPANPVVADPLELKNGKYDYWGAQVQATPETLLVSTNSYNSVLRQSTSTVHVIDISDPANPGAAGVIDVGGEPTSVGVVGDYAVVTVATSASFTEPSGIFHVIDIASQEVLRTGDLGGQPDAVAVSPDGDYVAIAIENERDEDLNDGLLPQLPAGFLVIMDTASSNVEDWSLRDVSLTGLDGVLYPDDPEPEFVAINDDNIGKLYLVFHFVSTPMYHRLF